MKKTKPELNVNYIIIDGPPWTIAFYNIHNVPIKIYTCRDRQHASTLGQEIALDRGVRLTNRADIDYENLPIKR